MHFEIVPHLLSVLSKRDVKKMIKRAVVGTLEGKRKRSNEKHTKITKEHIYYMNIKRERIGGGMCHSKNVTFH